jgi:hypothetical protein
MPHEVDDFAAQGTPDTLSITGDGLACILSCLMIVYSGGFTFFEEPHDEIKWEQLGHSTRDAWYFGDCRRWICMNSFLFAEIFLLWSIFYISRYSDFQDQSLLAS